MSNDHQLETRQLNYFGIRIIIIINLEINFRHSNSYGFVKTIILMLTKITYKTVIIIIYRYSRLLI
jgi:hypothetical protein